MHSYPDAWSVVSGRVEAHETPLQTARREIREETGYQGDSLRPLAAAAPFEVFEEARDTLWRVHSFLWLLHDPESPHLNRENDESRWSHPSEVEAYKTVPRLSEALHSLLPQPPERLLRTVRELRGDLRHGAAELTAFLLRELDELIPALSNWAEVVVTAQELATARPAMTPLAQLSWRWLSGQGPLELKEGPAPRVAPLRPRERELLRDRVRQLKLEYVQALTRTASAGARRLLDTKTVATFSSSSTVRDAFDKARETGRAPRTVLLSRALPGGEGVALAEELRGMGYEVTLLEDEDLVSRIADAELLIVGADSVFQDGSFANKIGTARLAAAARAAHRRVVVLADTFKRAVSREDFAPETVLSEGGKSPLFEIVEAGLADEVVDESMSGMDRAI
jgi:8-oxo-dGTP pyrophosphatase MutT (NUDIX family)